MKIQISIAITTINKHQINNGHHNSNKSLLLLKDRITMYKLMFQNKKGQKEAESHKTMRFLENSNSALIALQPQLTCRLNLRWSGGREEHLGSTGLLLRGWTGSTSTRRIVLQLLLLLLATKVTCMKGFLDQQWNFFLISL